MTDEFQYDISNVEFNEAFDFVTKKSGNLFLTGKAGTGKTTFLKYVKQVMGDDGIVVAAPTGIAAVNAGGMTLHSLFQLPFGPIPPNDKRFEIDTDKPNKSIVFKELHINSKKKKLLRQMKLLIIDEISMVRADVVDAIDKLLKAVTGKIDKPFGGKQVLMIGDNFQLPPVSKPNEDEILGPHYKSPFFFDSHVFYNYPPAVIELKKIYRQHDENFIDILNQVRNSSITTAKLKELNERFDPTFKIQDKEPYILISTHNQTVDKINKSKLASIDSDMRGLEGILDGDFDGSRLPTQKILNLKIGAQVMFLRNDSEKEKRYFNGTIGFVDEFKENSIVVRLENNTKVEVGRESWQNVKYEWNDKENRIDSEIIGEFSQFPLKLAWAITVHKSQGLTFDKVILDLNRCFAPGQTYVALSRCRTLEGIVLKTKIPRHTIKTAAEVIEFEKMISGIV